MKKIGVVGAGAMGSGITQVAVQSGCEVCLIDTTTEALDKSSKGLISQFDRLIEKGKLSKDQKDTYLQNLKWSLDKKELSNCDLVIEAIIENLEIKKSLFSELETIVSETCILASNTSSLSITAIAAACSKPERVIGIHFFNPAALMELVEIIPAIQTQPSVSEQCFDTIRNWNKKPVLAKDTPGFIVNRIARPFYSEALRIAEEGIADYATIDWAMTTMGGFRMGPFTLMDFIGHDVNFRVTESMFQAFYGEPRYKPSFSQKRLLEANWLGKKSGKGFYNHSETLPVANENEELGKTIFERILVMLINEAAEALNWGVATIESIDIAMQKGVNYPKGLLKWADEFGIENCVEKLDELFDFYHEERYRCSPLLRRKAQKKETFY